MQELDLNSLEFEQQIVLRDAYLIMFEFLSRHWDGCWEIELGAVMGELSLLTNEQGARCPLDAVVLQDFLKACDAVCQAQLGPHGYSGADFVLEPKEKP
ncbi:hypothetical protein KR51_00006670 [Rubidibacter lacunae KORDI 51-2]|uniref:Uncharacterized protein n=1 Tax=Rubidibacter lacunae KORDI 51-2 TaxID=582515 RepID=U5DP77_9CHRO|nr:hypothetical protein KR51_00006670 [Rubidibacter lacunae KORDI 51-2]